MMSGGLIPIVTSDTVPTSTSVVFPEVQKWQNKYFASSANAYDGEPMEVIPISNLWRKNTKIFSYINQLKFELVLQNYSTSIVDASNTYSASNW